MRTYPSLVMLCATLGFAAPAECQTSYSVDDAYQQMSNEIRKHIEPTPVPGNWLSITAIGEVAEKDDPSAINELANFCPDVTKDIVRFGGIRPLDLVYEKAVESMVGPVIPETQDIKDAKTAIRGASGTGRSNEYEQYLKFVKASSDLFEQMLKEKDESNLNALFVRQRNLERDWKVEGFKNEIEAALFRLDASDGLFGPVHNFHRMQVLNTFRANGITKTWMIGSFSSPASEVSPPVASWDNSSGWFTVTAKSKDYVRKASSTGGTSSGNGFLHVGGLIGGISSGGGNSRTWSLNTVKEYGFSFEVKRVRIIRRWFDPRVFSTVGGWAWKKKGDGKEMPLISGGYSKDNQPIAAVFQVYDNLPVDCPMIPAEMLIAKNRSVTLTTSREEFEEVKTAGKSKGGGFFGGIIGGSKGKSWNTTETSQNGNEVTYRIDAPGTAVIGLMSNLVGRIPEPDPKLNWPKEAWTGGTK